jgi:hypothetical protein
MDAVLAFLPLTLVVTGTCWRPRGRTAPPTPPSASGRSRRAGRCPGSARSIAVIAGAAVAVLLAVPPGVLPPTVAVAGLTVVPLLAWGLATYTRQESPLPTVVAMGWLVAVQVVAWVAIG